MACGNVVGGGEVHENIRQLMYFFARYNDVHEAIMLPPYYLSSIMLLKALEMFFVDLNAK